MDRKTMINSEILQLQEQSAEIYRRIHQLRDLEIDEPSYAPGKIEVHKLSDGRLRTHKHGFIVIPVNPTPTGIDVIGVLPMTYEQGRPVYGDLRKLTDEEMILASSLGLRVLHRTQ